MPAHPAIRRGRFEIGPLRVMDPDWFMVLPPGYAHTHFVTRVVPLEGPVLSALDPTPELLRMARFEVEAFFRFCNRVLGSYLGKGLLDFGPPLSKRHRNLVRVPFEWVESSGTVSWAQIVTTLN